MDEFKLCSDQLQKRMARVRKTVKFRNAIPVIEIYVRSQKNVYLFF